MNIKENAEVMIFKNDDRYAIGMSKKDRNNQWYNGYFPCKFKKGVDIENKTKIILKNAFISFYLNEGKTIPYIMIMDFEKAEQKDNYFELKGEVRESDFELPF